MGLEESGRAQYFWVSSNPWPSRSRSSRTSQSVHGFHCGFGDFPEHLEFIMIRNDVHHHGWPENNIGNCPRLPGYFSTVVSESGDPENQNMATALAPVSGRDVVRCDFCSLVQFIGADNNCRRCRKDLDEQPPTAKPVPLAPVVPIRNPSSLSLAIKSLRLAKGLSQRLLAEKMSVPRSWISKVESLSNCPTIPSLRRLAAALDMSVPEVLDAAEEPERQAKKRLVAEFMADGFVAEVVPHVAQLSSMQRTAILSRMRDMTTRQRVRTM